MVELDFLRHALGSVKDPRAGNARHKLFDILFVALAATLANSKTCFQMALYAREKEAWLTELLGWRHGPPSHDTFSRVFRVLDPAFFEKAFRQLGKLVGQVLKHGSIVALDGKAVRNAVSDGKRYQPLHLVNLWACEERIALAQVKAPNRNEVAGALELLAGVSIAGAIVTTDALHCRRDICEAILAKGADYVLPVKGNRPKLLKDIIARFARTPPASRAEQKTCRSHGRFERRRATVIRAPGLAAEHGYAGIRAIGCIEAWRGLTKLPRKPRCRYFVLSTYMSANRLLHTSRSHWGIEADLHWSLDVVFGEDRARTCLDHAPENLAILRKIALNMLNGHPAKMPLNHKMKAAGWNNNFLLEILRHAYFVQQAAT